jgi:short-subunit dehydrogenase
MTFTRALITGASSGIGMALARLLAGKGLNLTLCGRDKEALQALYSELVATGISVDIIVGDLVSVSDRQHVIESITTNSPDLVINNAGCGIYGNLVDVPLADQLNLITLNVTAAFELTVVAAKTLRRASRQGTILNISSAAAFMPFPGAASYAASKSFVKQFSLALDAELKPHAIRILTACPGVVTTAFRQRAGGVTLPQERLAMTASYAAEQLWWQIEHGKALHIFDWRYRLLLGLANFLPRNLVMRILQRSLRSLH